MKLLLDTHYVFGLAGTPTALSERERRFLSDYPEKFVISAVSIWEIRLKWQSLNQAGMPKGPASPTDVVRILAGDEIVEFVALTSAHAATALMEPLAHRDPFDELLLAQAQVEGYRLLTRDRKLTDHTLAILVS